MNVAESNATCNPSAVQCDEQEKEKRIRILTACLPKADRLIRNLRIPEQHHNDARQEAAISIIESIDDFDPSRGVQFWTFAKWRVLNVIRKWMRTGYYWSGVIPGLSEPLREGDSTASAEPKRDEHGRKVRDRAERCQRRDRAMLRAVHASLTPEMESLLTFDQVPEELFSERELTYRLLVFLGTLDPDDLVVFARLTACKDQEGVESATRRCRRLKSILARAREFLDVDGGYHGHH